MDLLAIILAATAAVELLAALLFAFTFVRRPADREYGVAAMLCVAACEHAVGSLLAARATDAAAALAADRVAWLGLLALLPMAIDPTSARRRAGEVRSFMTFLRGRRTGRRKRARLDEKASRRMDRASAKS